MKTQFHIGDPLRIGCGAEDFTLEKPGDQTGRSPSN
jgi:hypothetical protein